MEYGFEPSPKTEDPSTIEPAAQLRGGVGCGAAVDAAGAAVASSSESSNITAGTSIARHFDRPPPPANAATMCRRPAGGRTCQRAKNKSLAKIFRPHIENT